MENSKQSKDRLEILEMMYEPFKCIYTEDEIDEMILAEVNKYNDQYLKEENKNKLNTK